MPYAVLNQRLARFEKPVPLCDADGRSVQSFLHRLDVDKRLVDGVDLIAHGVLTLGFDKPSRAGSLDRCLLTIGSFSAGRLVFSHGVGRSIRPEQQFEVIGSGSRGSRTWLRSGERFRASTA